MAEVELFARTEVGCVRERNEDAFVVVSLAEGAPSGLRPQLCLQPDDPGVFLAVCDGMGGHAAGDVASNLGINNLEDVVRRRAPFASIRELDRALLDATMQANRAILEYATQNPSRQGMGTTLVGLALWRGRATIVSVGDSRVYLLRDGVLKQLTRDHSVVGQLIDAGEITAEEARKNEQRNMLLQALGVSPQLVPDLIHLDLCDGDRFMLCSDGVSDLLEDAQIAELLRNQEEASVISRRLTEAACKAGGHDNATVAVATVRGAELPARGPLIIRHEPQPLG